MRAGASAKRPASRSIRTGRVTEGSRPTAAVRSSARTHALRGDRTLSSGVAIINARVTGAGAPRGAMSPSGPFRCRSHVTRFYSVRHLIACGARMKRGARMKPETIALHGGYGGDPTTKAVAVPIYQTVAYSFDSAAHGAALFDLEV